MVRITARRLRELGACPDGIERFSAVFPNGATLSAYDCCKADNHQLSLDWLAKTVLPPGALKRVYTCRQVAYSKWRRDSLLISELYNIATKYYRDAYMAKVEYDYEEFLCSVKAAEATRDRKIEEGHEVKSAWIEYQRLLAKLGRAYDKKIKKPTQEYERLCGPADVARKRATRRITMRYYGHISRALCDELQRVPVSEWGKRKGV